MSNVVVIVLVGAAESQEPSTHAALEAARRSLDDRAELVVQHAASPPRDSEALSLEKTGAAEAVVVLVWHGTERLRASAHVHHAREDRWFDRQIVFQRSDPPAERGRTVGFTLASMLPSRVLKVVPAADEPPPPTPLSPLARTDVELPAAPIEWRRSWRAGVDAMGAASFAIEGSGGGFGGGLAGRAYLAQPLALRLSVAGRVGDVPGAQAISRNVVLGAGVEWELSRATPRVPFVVGMGLGAIAAHEYVKPRSSGAAGGANTTTSGQSRWVPGATLGVFGAWFLTESAGIVLSLHSEALFGKTDIFVRGAHVGQLTPVRLVSAAGLRLRF